MLRNFHNKYYVIYLGRHNLCVLHLAAALASQQLKRFEKKIPYLRVLKMTNIISFNVRKSSRFLYVCVFYLILLSRNALSVIVLLCYIFFGSMLLFTSKPSYFEEPI